MLEDRFIVDRDELTRIIHQGSVAFRYCVAADLRVGCSAQEPTRRSAATRFVTGRMSS